MIRLHPARHFASALVLFGASMLALSGCEKSKTAPVPVQDALQGPARPALFLTQAWFWTDDAGKQQPASARLDIWRESGGNWDRTRLEDGDSNVFHKAVQWRDGILTIGAQRALLKHWRFHDGKWTSEVLWERAWGGKFDRLRDIEIGDVDGDGVDELVIATHDSGVVAVLEPGEPGTAPTVTEMDQQADTFVHEIEIGDIDGDGKKEFFATPSGRNQAQYSQSGGVVMYRWNGSKYERSWVEHQEGTHAKEILAHDMDKDGKSELFSVLEAEVGADGKTKRPVEIRQYIYGKDGTFTHFEIGTIPDRQTRFLIPGDFDGDGSIELIAPALKAGLFHFSPPVAGSPPQTPWTRTLIGKETSGFEHAAYAADLDADGKLELYVAGDDQGALVRYVHGVGGFASTTIGKLEKGAFTFNITAGKL